MRPPNALYSFGTVHTYMNPMEREGDKNMKSRYKVNQKRKGGAQNGKIIVVFFYLALSNY